METTVVKKKGKPVVKAAAEEESDDSSEDSDEEGKECTLIHSSARYHRSTDIHAVNVAISMKDICIYYHTYDVFGASSLKKRCFPEYRKVKNI